MTFVLGVAVVGVGVVVVCGGTGAIVAVVIVVISAAGGVIVGVAVVAVFVVCLFVVAAWCLFGCERGEAVLHSSGEGLIYGHWRGGLRGGWD